VSTICQIVLDKFDKAGQGAQRSRARELPDSSRTSYGSAIAQVTLERYQIHLPAPEKGMGAENSYGRGERDLLFDNFIAIHQRIDSLHLNAFR
jgi:hypothetical protein